MEYKRKKRDENDYAYDPAPKHLQVGHIKNQEKRLIIILEDAQLESVKVRLRFSFLFYIYKLQLTSIYKIRNKSFSYHY